MPVAAVGLRAEDKRARREPDDAARTAIAVRPPAPTPSWIPVSKPRIDGGPLRRIQHATRSGTENSHRSDPLGGEVIPGDVLRRLHRGTGRGRPLPDGVRGSAETELDADLSGVRLHTDAAADDVARSVQSVAFTHGRDIYFSNGSFAPGSAPGSHLLAHELAHVVERTAGHAGPAGTIGRANDPAEAAADRVADRVAPVLRRSLGPRPSEGVAAGTSSSSQAPLAALRRNAQLPTSPLRRRISKGGTAIKSTRGSVGVLGRAVTGKKDRLDTIGKVVDDYNKERDESKLRVYLDAIIGLCLGYLQQAGINEDLNEDPAKPSAKPPAKPPAKASAKAPAKPPTKLPNKGAHAHRDKKASIVEDILAEARRDRSRIAAQKQYVNDATQVAGRTAAPTKTALVKQTDPETAQGFVQGAHAQGQAMAQAGGPIPNATTVKPAKINKVMPAPATANLTAKQAQANAKATYTTKKEAAKSLAAAKNARTALPQLLAKYGITEAEAIAIRTYTVEDYRYINPAVAANDTWMLSQRPDANDPDPLQQLAPGQQPGDAEKARIAGRRAHLKPFKEEGGLHAGVMMSGLEKLPRKSGTLYRGFTFTRVQYDNWIGTGEVVNPAFGSASLNRQTANRFSAGDAAHLGIVCEMSVNNARDVRGFSPHNEGEWLLLPGSTFRIIEIKDITGAPRPGVTAPVRKLVKMKQVR